MSVNLTLNININFDGENDETSTSKNCGTSMSNNCESSKSENDATSKSLVDLTNLLPKNVISDLMDYIDLQKTFEQKKTNLSEIFNAQNSEIESLRDEYNKMEAALATEFEHDDEAQNQVIEMRSRAQQIKQEFISEKMEAKKIQEIIKQMESVIEEIEFEDQAIKREKRKLRRNFDNKKKQTNETKMWDGEHNDHLTTTEKKLDSDLKLELERGCYLELETEHRRASLQRLQKSCEIDDSVSIKIFSSDCSASFINRSSLTPEKICTKIKCTSTPNTSMDPSFSYQNDSLSTSCSSSTAQTQCSLAEELDITPKQTQVKSFKEKSVQTDKKIVCFIGSAVNTSENEKKKNLIDVVHKYLVKSKKNRPSVSSAITVNNTCVVKTDHYIMESMESKISANSKYIAKALKKLPKNF